jgi:hypothetical protein
MSTAAVSSNLVNFQSPGYFHQRRADLSQLSQDLKSGDLAAAQQDFNSIQTLAQGGPFASSGNAFAVSARQTDFASIGTALQAGDTAGAQQALTQLESTFQHQSVTLDPVPTAATGSTPSTSGSASAASPASGSPIVLNLGSIGSGEQITIGVSNSSSGGEQLNISLANSQSQSPEQISLNLQNSSQQVVLNLFNSSTTSSDSNSGVSVVA